MKTNVLWIYLLTSILGVISIVLPAFFLPDLKQYDSPLFSLVRTGIEGISMWSFGLLFLTGFGVKLWSNLSGWKIGLTTMALFPIMAILEMFVDSTSHNLFPIEFIFYAVYSVPAIIGVYIAQGIQKVFVKNNLPRTLLCILKKLANASADLNRHLFVLSFIISRNTIQYYFSPFLICQVIANYLNRNK